MKDVMKPLCSAALLALTAMLHSACTKPQASAPADTGTAEAAATGGGAAQAASAQEAEPLVRDFAAGERVMLTGHFTVYNGQQPNVRFVTEAHEIAGIGTGEDGDGSPEVLGLLREQEAQGEALTVTAELSYIGSVELPHYGKPLPCFSVERILGRADGSAAQEPQIAPEPFPSIRDVDLQQYFIKPSRFIAEEQHLSAGYGVYDYTVLYALGFSPAGKFACIFLEEWEGSGSARATLLIQDLVSDEEVLRLAGDDEDIPEGVVSRFVQKYGAAIDATLSEHGIRLSPCTYSPFPYGDGNTRVDMGVTVTPTGELLYEIIPIVSYECVATDVAGRRKVVTARQDVAVYDVFVCGWIQSPYEKRLAVVLAEKALGFEGSDLHYRLCGCSLVAGF